MLQVVLATKSAISFPLLSTCCMKILEPDVIKIMCQADHTSRTERKRRTTQKEYDRKKGERFMADKIFENNQVSIMGEIVSDFRFSHEVYGEGFYMVDVAVNRLSNYLDYIPLMISERLIDVNADYIGQIIYVNGQFRSFNRHEEKRTALSLSVFVRELEFLEELPGGYKEQPDFPGRIYL